MKTFVVLVFLLTGIALEATPHARAQQLPDAPAMPSATASSKKAAEKATADYERKRKKKIDQFIQKAFDAEVLSKVDTVPEPTEVWVKPNWAAVEFQTKEILLKAICANYCQEKPYSTWATIKDAMSGKDVGYFDENGLHLN